MKRETFDKIELNLQASWLRETKLYDLGIDISEATNNDGVIIDTLMSLVMTEQGYDWFNWFMYEADYISGKKLEHYKATEDDKEILRTIDELYDYLKKNKHFKV